jgi:hypothetical protein
MRPKRALSHRRATDVAKANHEDGDSHRVIMPRPRKSHKEKGQRLFRHRPLYSLG